MKIRTVQEDVLSVRADAAVICVENSIRPYADSCYYIGTDPLQEPLPAQRRLP